MSVARSEGRRTAKTERADVRFGFERATDERFGRRARDALGVRRFVRGAGARLESLRREAAGRLAARPPLEPARAERAEARRLPAAVDAPVATPMDSPGEPRLPA
jgi:hypothetical protein